MPRLHYNPYCKHNDSPVAPLRLLYARGMYRQALEEIKRLTGVVLTDQELLVARVHTEVARLALKPEWYHYQAAMVRLMHLTGLALQIDATYAAELRSRCIGLAGRFNDQDWAQYLLENFYEGIGQTPVTEAHWRLAQGKRVEHARPREALTFYLTVAMNLDSSERPCLHEMAVRRLASCEAKDYREGAVATLQRWGFPASLRPGTGEIALDELLVIP